MNERFVTFLLVEDNDDHAELVLQSLAEHRVCNRVDRAKDGDEAIVYLRDENNRPDVILLDLNLPKLSGLEVLEAIKSDPSLQSIPVVVLTTSEAELDRARAYEFHANSYLVKPVDFDQLQKLVEEVGLYWGVLNRRPPANLAQSPPEHHGITQ